MITNRPNRLRGVSYTGYQRYFLTTCTANRHPAFAEGGVAEECVLQLQESAKRHDFVNVAHCFMPDHVHILVYGVSLQADLPAFMTHFKKITGFNYSQRSNAVCGRSVPASRAESANIRTQDRTFMICGPFSPLGTSRSESPARQEEQV